MDPFNSTGFSLQNINTVKEYVNKRSAMVAVESQLLQFLKQTQGRTDLEGMRQSFKSLVDVLQGMETALDNQLCPGATAVAAQRDQHSSEQTSERSYNIDVRLAITQTEHIILAEMGAQLAGVSQLVPGEATPENLRAIVEALAFQNIIQDRVDKRFGNA